MLYSTSMANTKYYKCWYKEWCFTDCTHHICISLVLSNLTNSGEASGWIVRLSYFADVLLNSILWLLHGASRFQEGFIFTDIGVILAVNFGIYSIEIYVPQILQAEMIPSALRLKASGPEKNYKHGHKLYWLRHCIAEGA